MKSKTFKKFAAAFMAVVMLLSLSVTAFADNEEIVSELVDESAEETVKETAQEVSENVAEEASENVAEEASENVAEEISENVAEGVSENVTEGASENGTEEVSENVAEEVETPAEETVRNFVEEDVAEDTEEETEEPMLMSLFSMARSAITQIASLADLISFREAVNNGIDYDGVEVQLTEDIDIGSESDWVPIGVGERDGRTYDGDTPFKGIFNGLNHIIKNLTIVGEAGKNAAGLFGIVDGGTVKNLTLENVYINTTNSVTGAAVGMLVNNGTVENITVSGIVASESGVGGIVGRMTDEGTIKDCTNNAGVSGKSTNVGGIVGAAYYTDTGKEMLITGCENNGNVMGISGVGGIAGLSTANVEDCKNNGKINGSLGATLDKTYSIGGIVGEQKDYGHITGCENTALVYNDGTGYGTGGIVGWVRYPDGTPNKPSADYKVVDVIEVSGNKNSGRIRGGNDGGGIIGTAYHTVIVKGNANLASEISGKTFAAGIIGNYQNGDTSTYFQNPADHILIMRGNDTTTTIDKIEANCINLLAYINSTPAAGSDVQTASEHDFTSHAKLDPTCTDKGTDEYKVCELCGVMHDGNGNVITAVPELAATGHSLGSWTASGASGHLKSCTNSGCTYAEAVQAHSYGAWAVTKAAQVGQEGEQKRICADCSYAEVQTIPALPAPAEPATPAEPAEAAVTAAPVVVTAAAGDDWFTPVAAKLFKNETKEGVSFRTWLIEKGYFTEEDFTRPCTYEMLLKLFEAFCEYSGMEYEFDYDCDAAELAKDFLTVADEFMASVNK